MSARALRRLEKLKDLGVHKEDTLYSSSEEEMPAKKGFNAFATFGAESSDDNESEVEDDQDKVEEQENEKKNEEIITKKPISKKTKKLKSSKKKPTKPVASVDSDDELDQFLAEVKKRDQEKLSKAKGNSTHVNVDSGDSEEEEYDEEEFRIYDDYVEVDEFDANFYYFTGKKLQQVAKLLSVGSPKELDPDNEIRNLLGKLSAETVDDANTTTSFGISPEVLQQFKRLARLTRGWGGKDRRSVPGTARKLLFTRIKDDYLPTAQKPLGMEEISYDIVKKFLEFRSDWNQEDLPKIEYKLKQERKLGVKYFKFTKNITLQERIANTRFYAAVVMTPDPDSLIRLIQEFPYHAESLLQVAMVLLRQGSDKSASNALIERALFVFDRCLHKTFHEYLQEGKNSYIRLPYESYMNRQFYLCIFRYISVLGERSTFATALTYAKFLLSINPAEDPLGVRYFIDYYAIMSENYEWLIQFASSPLVTSYAMWLTPGVLFSVVLAYIRTDQIELAKSAIGKAFKYHRYTAYRLLREVGRASGSDLLQLEDNDDKSALELLNTETYLVRAAALWKNKKEIEFLHDELLELFKQNPKKGKSFFSSLFGSGKLDYHDAMPHNFIRFAVLSGENKLIAHIPERILLDLQEYDVLPPSDELYEHQEPSLIFGSRDKLIDGLLDYVDQNLLGAIIQNQTGEDGLQDIIDRLQLEENEQGDQNL